MSNTYLLREKNNSRDNNKDMQHSCASSSDGANDGRDVEKGTASVVPGDIQSLTSANDGRVVEEGTASVVPNAMSSTESVSTNPSSVYM